MRGVWLSWRMDETYIKVKGIWCYFIELWINRVTQLILFQGKCTMNAPCCICAFLKVLIGTGKNKKKTFNRSDLQVL
ncbi:MAG: hypothetical protein DI539_14055 [Flavobacterium psychrophilum]|nr:MAG: hypothetical protein DI539_14055 [Flavobacterium psychrophilum]